MLNQVRRQEARVNRSSYEEVMVYGSWQKLTINSKIKIWGVSIFGNPSSLSPPATPGRETGPISFLSLSSTKPDQNHGEPPPTAAGKSIQSSDCSSKLPEIDSPFSGQIGRRTHRGFEALNMVNTSVQALHTDSSRIERILDLKSYGSETFEVNSTLSTLNWP